MAPGRQLAFLWGGTALAGAAAAPFARTLAAGAPACLFHTLTGVPCPTCGATRAVLALGRLDVGAAFLWNPLVTLVVVAFLAGGLAALLAALAGKGVPDSAPPRWAGGVAALAFAANWVFVIAAGR